MIKKFGYVNKNSKIKFIFLNCFLKTKLLRVKDLFILEGSSRR